MNNDEPENKSDQTAKLPELNIEWTASEAIDHQRGVLWYIIAAILVIGVIALSFWLQGVSFSSITSTVLVVIIAVAIVTVSHRPSRELHYTLTNQGITIENQLHRFSDFRAFGVHQDGALWQLTLIPIKRFGLSVTMFIHDDQGEKIIDTLGSRLPMEATKTDIIDKVVHKLKI
jgi:membrane protein implicated in regulation of membrane protease activity